MQNTNRSSHTVVYRAVQVRHRLLIHQGAPQRPPLPLRRHDAVCQLLQPRAARGHHLQHLLLDPVLLLAVKAPRCGNVVALVLIYEGTQAFDAELLRPAPDACRRCDVTGQCEKTQVRRWSAADVCIAAELQQQEQQKQQQVLLMLMRPITNMPYHLVSCLTERAMSLDWLQDKALLDSFTCLLRGIRAPDQH